MCALNVAVTVMVAGDPTELQLVNVLTATVATMALIHCCRLQVRSRA